VPAEALVDPNEVGQVSSRYFGLGMIQKLGLYVAMREQVVQEIIARRGIALWNPAKQPRRLIGLDGFIGVTHFVPD
jgi:hypothetical protein